MEPARKNRGTSMHTIYATQKTGADGTLTLRLPLGRPDTEFEVVVVVHPKAPLHRGWPPGYFDLFGSIDDESFVRPPQGQLPSPVEIERSTSLTPTSGLPRFA